MRVLNVQMLHKHGGSPEATMQYSRALVRQGHEVITLTSKGDPFIEEQQRICLYAKSLRGFNGTYDVLSLVRARFILSRFKPQAILAHEGRSATIFARASFGRVPIIDINHGRGIKQSIGRDGTIVINSERKLETEKVASAHQKVYLLPSSLDEFGHTLPALPKKWQNPVVIGSVGRLVDEKAFDILIEAMAIVKKRGRIKCKVRIAGDGYNAELLRNLIKQYDLTDTIKLIGWVDNTDGFYQGVDIFCLPSRSEEFGLVLLEAMRYGLPIVACDSNGPSDIIKHNINGILVKKNNPEKLAQAIEWSVLHKKQLDAFAQQGYEDLKGRFSFAEFSRSLDFIIQDVVDRKRSKRNMKRRA